MKKISTLIFLIFTLFSIIFSGCQNVESVKTTHEYLKAENSAVELCKFFDKKYNLNTLSEDINVLSVYKDASPMYKKSLELLTKNNYKLSVITAISGKNDIISVSSIILNNKNKIVETTTFDKNLTNGTCTIESYIDGIYYFQEYEGEKESGTLPDDFMKNNVLVDLAKYGEYVKSQDCKINNKTCVCEVVKYNNADVYLYYMNGTLFGYGFNQTVGDVSSIIYAIAEIS